MNCADCIGDYWAGFLAASTAWLAVSFAAAIVVGAWIRASTRGEG